MSGGTAREVIRDYLDRFAAMTGGADVPPAYLLFDPHCRFEVTGSMPSSGVYHGLEAVARDCMGLLQRRLRSRPGDGWYLERFIGDGQRIVALLRSHSASQEGRPYCGSYFVIFEVRDGRIVHQLEILDSALFMDCVHDMQLEAGDAAVAPAA